MTPTANPEVATPGEQPQSTEQVAKQASWQKQAAHFLARYAAAMLASGGTSARCEKTVHRIAKAYATTAEVTILPHTVMATVWDDRHEHAFSMGEKLPATGLNFYFISRLSALSWKIRDHHITLDEAEREYQQILATPRLNAWLVTLLTGLANASFCRLFEGDWMAMLIVFIATVNGFWVKNALHRMWQWDMRLAVLVAACCSSIIACAGFMFHCTATPDIALGTSVLYLVPGIPYINSVSDLIHGHLLCCLSRFIEACVITACLGVGLSIGILLMNIQYF